MRPATGSPAQRGQAQTICLRKSLKFGFPLNTFLLLVLQVLQVLQRYRAQYEQLLVLGRHANLLLHVKRSRSQFERL